MANSNFEEKIKILPPKTRKLFIKFSESDFIKNFYLAGGTAIVLEFKHRISNDLDFFSQGEFENNSLKRDLKKLGKWEGSMELENTLVGYLDNIKSSFFYLPYKLIEKPRKFNEIKIADLTDLALMKILAVSQRAAKRDFVDIYILANEFMPLVEIIKLFTKKFGKFDYNLHHIIKSLVYFDEVKHDRMPRMLIDLDWKTVEKFFIEEQGELLNLLTKFRP